MANKIKTVKATNERQILFATQPYMAVGVVMSATGAVTVDGRKIQKAGTPIAGSLEARTTAFTVAADSGDTTKTSNAVAVLLHDVDVTDGAENATALIFGFVDLNKLESDVVTKVTAAAKTALSGKVTFLK